MKKKHIPEMDKRKSCFVSVYFSVFMFTCYPLSSNCYISTIFHDSHFTYTSRTQHFAAVHLQVCQKPLRGEIGALLRGHFERPNVLAPFHLHLQLSRSHEPPPGEIGAVRGKKNNCNKLHGITHRGTSFYVQ